MRHRAGLTCSRSSSRSIAPAGSPARSRCTSRSSRPGDAARRDLPDRRRARAGLCPCVRAHRRAGGRLYRFLFPGYTLVAYDDRGTGASGLIDCPAVQAAITADEQRTAATTCADTIGPNREFYWTADHAEDLEAVREALGVDKVALYGVSYGTKLAMSYASRTPITSSGCCSTRCSRRSSPTRTAPT